MSQRDQPALDRMDYATWDELVEMLLGPVLVSFTPEQIRQRTDNAQQLAAAAMRVLEKREPDIA